MELCAVIENSVWYCPLKFIEEVRSVQIRVSWQKQQSWQQTYGSSSPASLNKWILYTLERECTTRTISKCISYAISTSKLQAHRSTTNWCRKSSYLSILVHPFQEDNRQAGAAILKQDETSNYRTMHDFEIDEVDNVDGSPYKTSQIGGDVIESRHRSPRNMLNKTAGLQREWFWLQ